MICLFAAILTGLLGCAGLAVDVAHGYAVRAVLQHAVDDGALTAERWSAQVDDAGSNPAAVVAEAVSQAIATAERDARAGGLGGSTAVTAALSGSHLRIAAQVSVNTWFLPLFGITSWLPAASADTVLWTPGAAGAPMAPPPGTGSPSASPPAPPPAASPPVVGAGPPARSAPFVTVPAPPPTGVPQQPPGTFATPAPPPPAVIAGPTSPETPAVPPEINGGAGPGGSSDLGGDAPGPGGGGAGDPGSQDSNSGDGGDVDNGGG